MLVLSPRVSEFWERVDTASFEEKRRLIEPLMFMVN